MDLRSSLGGPLKSQRTAGCRDAITKCFSDSAALAATLKNRATAFFKRPATVECPVSHAGALSKRRSDQA